MTESTRLTLFIYRGLPKGDDRCGGCAYLRRHLPRGAVKPIWKCILFHGTRNFVKLQPSTRSHTALRHDRCLAAEFASGAAP